MKQKSRDFENTKSSTPTKKLREEKWHERNIILPVYSAIAFLVDNYHPYS